MDLLTRTIGENIAIEQRLSDNLWAVAADQTQLDTALLNLAINARDAMPDGGKLVFESSNIHVDEDCAQLSRSEEHTSELQSLMRISYAVFCLKKKKTKQ